MTYRRTPYASVQLTVPAREALRRASRKATAELDRRVSQSEILLAALALTGEEQLVDALRAAGES